MVAPWLGRGVGFLAALVGILTPSVKLLKQTFTIRSGNIILVLLGCLSERVVQSLSCKSVLGWCARTQVLFALLVPKPSLISQRGAGGYVGVLLLGESPSL